MKIQRDSNDMRVIGLLETTEASENSHIGIRASLPKMVSGSAALLQYVYTNAHRMGNIQEELEAIVQWGIAAIAETWWDDLHN